MKKSLDHLPIQKQQELERITEIIRRECDDVDLIMLFGSYARGDWKDGPHQQGRGRLLIHKKSDYDILVLTRSAFSASDVTLWHEIKEACRQQNFSTYVRIIARHTRFINLKLRQGQYFFTEIINEGISLYHQDEVQLAQKQAIDPSEEIQLIQGYLDDVFALAEQFFDTFQDDLKKTRYKKAAFELHQACEHAYKAVLLIYGGECPQEHHLDILDGLASDYCPDLAGLLPRERDEQRHLFELLDYAYIGARYDYRYKITQAELDQLGLWVKKLQAVVERCCLAKLERLQDRMASRDKQAEDLAKG